MPWKLPPSTSDSVTVKRSVTECWPRWPSASRAGITPKSLGEEVDSLITQLGPLPSVADISAKEVLAAIKRDKKVVNGKLHFVAAADRGKTVELTDVSEKEIATAVKKIGLRT